MERACGITRVCPETRRQTDGETQKPFHESTDMAVISKHCNHGLVSAKQSREPNKHLDQIYSEGFRHDRSLSLRATWTWLTLRPANSNSSQTTSSCHWAETWTRWCSERLTGRAYTASVKAQQLEHHSSTCLNAHPRHQLQRLQTSDECDEGASLPQKTQTRM